jgi:hypothetical protein
MPQLVWLITGCSSGFGEQFVHSILARGDKVIATARNLQKIQHLKQHNVEILQLDITDDQTSINATMQKALSLYGQIDVLINNAAFIQVGTLEDVEYEQWRAQFETNVFGTIRVTRALLPHFRQRKSGVNVFISSLSGWIGHDFCGPYASSKFALEGGIIRQPYLLRILIISFLQVSSSPSGARPNPSASGPCSLSLDASGLFSSRTTIARPRNLPLPTTTTSLPANLRDWMPKIASSLVILSSWRKLCLIWSGKRALQRGRRCH